MTTNVISRERKTYSKLKYNKYQKKTVILETVAGWAFISPLMIVALIFSTAAIGIGVWLTFYSGINMSHLHYVGTRNWELIGSASLNLGAAFKNTFFYAIVSVPIIIITSLIVSGILNSKWLKGKRTFLAIFFLPQVTSAVASTLIFKQLFSPDGMIKVDYIHHPEVIMWVVIMAAIWGGVAGSLITFNTAFATIDSTQYEAADLDGAGGLKKFLNITIPSIGPVVAYALIMGIIGGFGVFDGPYLLASTSGVDSDAMTTLVLKGFNYIMPSKSSGGLGNMGLGTTILFVTAITIAGATFIGNLFFPMNKSTH